MWLPRAQNLHPLVRSYFRFRYFCDIADFLLFYVATCPGSPEGREKKSVIFTFVLPLSLPLLAVVVVKLGPRLVD